jgi:hypothetical protein
MLTAVNLLFRASIGDDDVCSVLSEFQTIIGKIQLKLVQFGTDLSKHSESFICSAPDDFEFSIV